MWYYAAVVEKHCLQGKCIAYSVVCILCTGPNKAASAEGGYVQRYLHVCCGIPSDCIIGIMNLVEEGTGGYQSDGELTCDHIM